MIAPSNQTIIDCLLNLSGRVVSTHIGVLNLRKQEERKQNFSFSFFSYFKMIIIIQDKTQL